MLSSPRFAGGEAEPHGARQSPSGVRLSQGGCECAGGALGRVTGTVGPSGAALSPGVRGPSRTRLPGETPALRCRELPAETAVWSSVSDVNEHDTAVFSSGVRVQVAVLLPRISLLLC